MSILARIMYEDDYEGKQKIEGITEIMFPFVISPLARNKVEMTVELYDDHGESALNCSLDKAISNAGEYFVSLLVDGFGYLQVSNPDAFYTVHDDVLNQLYFYNIYGDVRFDPSDEYFIMRVSIDGMTFTIDYIDQYILIEQMQPRDFFVNNIIADRFCNYMLDKDLIKSKSDEAISQLNLGGSEELTTDRVEELVESNFSALVVTNHYFDYTRPEDITDSYYMVSSLDELDPFKHDDIKKVLNDLIDDSFDSNYAIYVQSSDAITGVITASFRNVSSVRESSIAGLCGYTSYFSDGYYNHPENILKYTKITKDGTEVVKYAGVIDIYKKYPMLLRAIINNDFTGFDDQPQPEQCVSIRIIDDETITADPTEVKYKENYKPNILIIELG